MIQNLICNIYVKIAELRKTFLMVTSITLPKTVESLKIQKFRKTKQVINEQPHIKLHEPFGIFVLFKNCKNI